MMISLILLLTIAPARDLPQDTSRAALARPERSEAPLEVPAHVPQDTVRRRPRAIEVSEWYGRRLTIHRALSYAMIPVFGAQYYAGNRLYNEGTLAPDWARPVHQIGAGTVAGIFTVNTVTGVWNLWDSRKAPEHRTLRTVHALMMLAADAGFTYTGVVLSREAGDNADKRRQHRAVAVGSMGVAIGSGVIMKIFNK